MGMGGSGGMAHSHFARVRYVNISLRLRVSPIVSSPDASRRRPCTVESVPRFVESNAPHRCEAHSRSDERTLAPSGLEDTSQ